MQKRFLKFAQVVELAQPKFTYITVEIVMNELRKLKMSADFCATPLTDSMSQYILK